MSELAETIKRKLFAKWLPNKPGGLQGLINMAATCAEDACGELIEGYAEQVVTLTARIEALLQPTPTREAMRLPELDMDDEGWDGVESDSTSTAGPDTLLDPGPPPMSSYDCSECGHSHQVDSKIGSEHLVAYMEEQEKSRAAQVQANVEAVNPNELAGK